MKGLGYLISTISVLLLGAAAWPKPDEPSWKAVAVAAGMATSILGMFLRFLSHRGQVREIDRVEERVGERPPSPQRAALGRAPAGAASAMSAVE